jgi:hypothetical protein
VCLIVHKTTSELELMILTTLYLADEKTPIVGVLGSEIYSVLFLWMFRWFPHLCLPSPLMMKL